MRLIWVEPICLIVLSANVPKTVSQILEIAAQTVFGDFWILCFESRFTLTHLARAIPFKLDLVAKSRAKDRQISACAARSAFA